MLPQTSIIPSHCRQTTICVGKRNKLSGWLSEEVKSRKMLTLVQIFLEPYFQGVLNEVFLTDKQRKTFRVDSSKHYDKFEQKYKANIINTLASLTLLGIDPLEGAKIMKDAFAHTSGFIRSKSCIVEGEDDSLTFSNQYTMESLERWTGNMRIDAFIFASNRLGSFKLMGTAHYSEGDLKFLNGKPKCICEHLSCFHYTLLSVREEQAKTDIMADAKVEEDFVKKLKTWGYKASEGPCDGDLILYFNQNDPVPKHMGRVAGSGIVSKLGWYNPKVGLHDILNVPEEYGNKFVFMRKG